MSDTFHDILLIMFKIAKNVFSSPAECFKDLNIVQAIFLVTEHTRFYTKRENI